MRLHTTHHIYKFTPRKKLFENIFFLEKSPVQPLAQDNYKHLDSICMTFGILSSLSVYTDR